MPKQYTFADFLEDQMKQRGMSIRQFAEYVGVATTTVSRAVNGKNPKRPGLDFLLKLAAATGHSLLYLIELAYPEAVEQTGPPVSAKLLAQDIASLSEDKQRIIRAFIRDNVG